MAEFDDGGWFDAEQLALRRKPYVPLPAEECDPHEVAASVLAALDDLQRKELQLRARALLILGQLIAAERAAAAQ
jgi:hypothetical protein